MATHESKSTHKPNIKTTTDSDPDPVCPLANFPPSIWGDRFLSLSIDRSELQTYAKAMEEPKDELRRMITNPSMNSNAKLRLINSVYRLGLTYVFTEEIDGQLGKLFKEVNLKDYDELDLYTVSVNFQVFRQFGYNLSCDVFNKFKDCSSGCKFKKYITFDLRGMLSFYESTQLRIKGESILDEALIFTEAWLKSVVDRLEGEFSRQVKHALSSPFHRGIQMVEAKLYFFNYEDECSTYGPLLNLAKANFSYLQQLHKEELYTLIKWGKEMDFQRITPYARDRIPDLYLWALAVFSEPHYAQARIIIGKTIQLICVLDDTYDAYATNNELRVLTNAIQRWELSVVDHLPEYVKPLYKVLLNEHTELEKQLSKEGRANRVYILIEAFQELVRAYLQEAEWRHSGYVPSFQEYMENGLTTSTYNVFLKSFFVGMGDVVSDEDMSWYETHPKILEAVGLLGRVYNDVATFQFESERAIQQITSVEAYMKTFGVREDVAVDELKKMLENAWKDINEGCLKPTAVSMEVLAPTLNLARMTDVIYRDSDKFTFPGETIKDYITLLFDI